MESEDSTPEPLNYRPARTHSPPVPSGTGALGMRLFLISLFMLFAAAMMGYALIRTSPNGVKQGRLHFPHLLWISTALVICVSLTMGRAVAAVRRERQPAFRFWLLLSLALAIGFLLVQAPAMAGLLAEHQRMRVQGRFLYGLVFVLILLHALHVAGGMIALLRISFRGRHGAYDHEHYQPVRFAAWYWHFLDFIWIVMFLTFLLTA